MDTEGRGEIKKNLDERLFISATLSPINPFSFSDVPQPSHVIDHK